MEIMQIQSLVSALSSSLGVFPGLWGLLPRQGLSPSVIQWILGVLPPTPSYLICLPQRLIIYQ